MARLFRTVFIVTVAICTLLVAGAWAGIDNGPWLTGVTQSAITVKWESPDPYGIVEYGLTPSLGSTAGSTFSEGVHQADLSGLESAARYYYTVTSGGESSAIHSFLTAPAARTPFHFAVISDTQQDQSVHRAIVDAMILDEPEFVLNNGDLVDLPFFQILWENFWDTTGLIAGDASYFPIRGNHDGMLGGLNAFERYFGNPMNEEAVSQYAFQYGNTYFIQLDINQPYGVGTPQYAWTETQLQIAKNLNGVHHCIVRGHYPPYSCSNHGDDANVLAFREAMAPLFERYGIDLYMSGHDHGYQRSEVNGITYIVAAGGGGGLYDCTPQTWTMAWVKVHHYIHVDVDGMLINVEARTDDGTVIDAFAIDNDYREGQSDTDDDDDDDDDDSADDGDDDDDDDDSGCCG